jgi:threonine synthase
MQTTIGNEGISICPESACCIGAMEVLTEERWIRPDDRVVVFNCASARKYPDVIDLSLPKLARAADIDWTALQSARK